MVPRKQPRALALGYAQQPSSRGVQFEPGAVLQHSRTPTPPFEHEDEHEHEDDFDAPGEGERGFKTVPGVKTPG
jgi:hypothetical protein